MSPSGTKCECRPDVFRTVFERVVEACIRAGLVGGERFAVPCRRRYWPHGATALGHRCAERRGGYLATLNVLSITARPAP